MERRHRVLRAAKLARQLPRSLFDRYRPPHGPSSRGSGQRIATTSRSARATKHDMLLTAGLRLGIRIPAQVRWTRSELPDAKAKGPTRKCAGPLACAPVERRNKREAPSARTRSPCNVFRRILLTPLGSFRPKAFQSTRCPIRRPFKVHVHCRTGPGTVQAKSANGAQFLVDKSRNYPLFIHRFIHIRRRRADRPRALEAIGAADPAGTGGPRPPSEDATSRSPRAGYG